MTPGDLLRDQLVCIPNSRLLLSLLLLFLILSTSNTKFPLALVSALRSLPRDTTQTNIKAAIRTRYGEEISWARIVYFHNRSEKILIWGRREILRSCGSKRYV